MRWCLPIALVILSGCANRDFRCESKLRPINAVSAAPVVGRPQNGVSPGVSLAVSP
jgi:hypothetical protein